MLEILNESLKISVKQTELIVNQNEMRTKEK